WPRMQVVHSSSNCVALPDPVTGELPPPPLLLADVPLLLPRLATCGALEPPLHAASPMAAAAARTASPPDRRHVVVICSLLSVSCRSGRQVPGRSPCWATPWASSAEPGAAAGSAGPRWRRGRGGSQRG